MSTCVREAIPEDASVISSVVQACFMEHVAPDWTSSAQQEFLRGTTAEELAAIIAEAALVEVYEEAEQILGVLLLPRPTLVQLFFVAPDRLRRGVGKALWEVARKHLEERFPEVKTVELNSSPYAVPAYKALGFFPISKPFRRRGAVATRMACWLPGRALAEEKHVV
jgi:GNAT superfamily N-acetyltransferase